VHGAGAEEEDGIGFPASYAGEALFIGIDRTECAIGDDFGDLRTIPSERKGRSGLARLLRGRRTRFSSDALA